MRHHRNQLANFSEQARQALASIDERIAQLEAKLEAAAENPPLSPGAELARLKALREHGQLADRQAGAASAQGRRSGMLVPAEPPRPDLVPPGNDAGAGASAAKLRQKRI